MVLIMRLRPLVGLRGLLLLHLDWPHLTVQRQRGHSQTLVLLLAVKIIEIPAGRDIINMMIYKCKSDDELYLEIPIQIIIITSYGHDHAERG